MMRMMTVGGRASRAKGKRGEYSLRDYFRTLGYVSHRVPSSGAAQGAKGDVTLEGHGIKLTAELKVRQNEFKSIYALYSGLGGRPMSINFENQTVIVSKDFEDLGYRGQGLLELIITGVPKEYQRAAKKMFNLKKFVKTCDFLVIKIDRHDFIFLRYL